MSYLCGVCEVCDGCADRLDLCGHDTKEGSLVFDDGLIPESCTLVQVSSECVKEALVCERDFELFLSEVLPIRPDPQRLLSQKIDVT